MPDEQAVKRSLKTVINELEYLRDSGVIIPPQFQSIMAQLPQNPNQSSLYTDPRYAQGNNYIDPARLAAASNDPNHPANPNHPKHAQWAKNLGNKLGNAFVFGAGATAGGDLINHIF